MISTLETDTSASGWAALTETQRAVAELVSQALTNQQIARRMRRSPHTVNYHLRQIFRKLDIVSRVELARIVMTQRPRRDAAAAQPGDQSGEPSGLG